MGHGPSAHRLRALTLDGQSRTVIGIMPPGFQFPAELDLWLPLALEVNQKRKAIVNVVGRLKPGVTPEAARTDLTAILRRMSRSFAPGDPQVQVRVIGLRERLVGDVQRALLVLFGAVAFVLLIACANVANLLLARAAARQKEMAIRAAVGAGRLRLVRQLLTESLLLSLAGGGLGLLLATWGIKLLVRMNPDGIARIQESRVDGRVLGFTCAVAVLTGLLAGVFPALQASKTNVNETLKVQSASHSASRGMRRSLPALMIAELALTLVLLAGAGLMIKSFLRLLAVPKGFNPDGVLTLELSPSLAKYPLRSPQRRAYYQESLARALEPNEPINPVVTMDERLSDSVAQRRYQTLLLGVFAAVALIIATVGIYGAISYAVSQRTHEIGIRMALGAQTSDVPRLVVRQGMGLTLIGVAIGLAAALALTRVMKSLLFNVSATDPATFASIALLLVIVALLASYIPARRATKVDPLMALRHE